MLLLVLILVLAAFALLVIALVQASVTWAWFSVGVSVVAAGALLFDWWQRQQAARDEEAPPPATARTSTQMPLPRIPGSAPPDSEDLDPATEFIPVMPRHGGYEPPEEAEQTRFIRQESREDDVEQTVILPQMRPSGSAEQPPGATAPPPSWPSEQSRSVTEMGPQAVGPSDAAGPVVADADLAQDEDATVVRSPDGGPADEPAAETTPGGDTEIAPSDLPPAGPDGEPPEEAVEVAAVSTVAELQDEVVVVDERPRFHVTVCPFLPGRPLIPLPVAEAVELGFSPCGWCTPVQVIAGRRRAPAR